MEAVASRILDAGLFANLPIIKRLELLVGKLNEMHYQAHWEAGAEGPRVIFGRCPYSQVIEKHPELCKMDTAMLEESLTRSVSQFTKSETVSRGLCPFIFAVK
jgi:predicted ArsR family transcriptional regulator